MISSRASDGSFFAIPQEPDDLFTLRRIISIGDIITASTTRSIKPEREHARPDRGERVRISLSINVEKISLDSVLDRLRISGTITESSNEAVSHGSHHSVVITPGERIKISKKDWPALDRSLLQKKQNDRPYVLVAIDSRECGIARLTGTHLNILPNIHSGVGGKRYRTTQDPKIYYGVIKKSIISCIQKDDGLILFGPGQEKNRLATILEHVADITTPVIADGIDSGGEDGIYIFAKSQKFQDVVSDSKLARVLGIVDDVIRLAGLQSNQFAMGYKDVARAAQTAAAAQIVFSDKLLVDVGEDAAVELLNTAESSGARVYAVDTSTDVGMRVSGLGGVIALLRFGI